MATGRTAYTSPPGFAKVTKETSDRKPNNRSKHSISEDGTLSTVLFRPLGPDVPLGEFKQRLEMISSDLHHLLQLDTQDFWSMISFDRSILRTIDSFLRFSPRHWFELEKLPEDVEIQELLGSVSRLVFLVLLRLSTNKDTGVKPGKDKKEPQRELFLQPAEFGQLIYDRHIWTVPMLFDTVALFGRKNGALLTRMIESLFSCQPKFTDDLSAAFSSTEIALRQLSNQLDEIFLMKTHDNRSLLSQLSDMIVFSFDAFSTLEIFVTLYQPSATIIEQNCTTLMAYCAEFADSTLQALKNQLEELAGKISCQEPDCSLLDVGTLLKIAAATELRIVNTFHALVNATCLHPPDNVHPEKYFSALTTVVGHHRFVWLLDQLQPVQSDIAFLEKNSHENVDVSCKDYLISAVFEVKRQFAPDYDVTERSPPQKSPELKAIATGGPSQSEIDEMVHSVWNVMGQNLDPKFIRKCLLRFDYNVDALVQTLLDDNLPPDLHEEQHEEERYDYTSENIKAALTSVHIGKRDQVLDPNEVKEMKPFYNKFANVVTIVTKAPNQPESSDLPSNYNINADFERVYEDEYDDTYDDNEGAVGPQGSHGDELLRRRAFVVPRVLSAGADRVNDEESSESEEEEEAEKQQPQIAQPVTGYGAGGGRGQWQGRDSAGRGRGQKGPAPRPGPEEQESERFVPSSGDTRGFKGASRDRHKIETAASRGGASRPPPQQQQQRPQSDYGRGAGPSRTPREDHAPRTARPVVEDRQAPEENGHAENNRQDRPVLPEDVQRMKKERNKASFGNHNRRDLAARKRREF